MGTLGTPLRSARRREPRRLSAQRPVLAAADRILDGLAAETDTLVATIVAGAIPTGAYRDLPAAEHDDVAATMRHGLRAVVGALREDRDLRPAEIAFVRTHIARRAAAGIPESDMLAVVRVFERVVWQAIVDLAGAHREGGDAVLALTGPLLVHVDTLAHEVCQAFADATAARALDADQRRELIELLLSGQEPPAGPLADEVRRAGLDSVRPFVVLVARTPDGATPVAEALVAGLRQALSPQAAPLLGLRHTEVLVLAALGEDQLGRALRDLRELVAGAHAAGAASTVGVSPIRHGLREIPAAYEEARLAESWCDAGTVLALGELGVADYIVRRGADPSAWRLVPARVRQFVGQDTASGAVLCDTAMAYLGANLSVKLAAERLHVHPNTVHYRLSRIEERTGLSLRTLSDALTMAIAIRLHGAVGQEVLSG